MNPNMNAYDAIICIAKTLAGLNTLRQRISGRYYILAYFIASTIHRIFADLD